MASMSSATPPTGSSPPLGSIARTPSDPSRVAPGASNLLQLVRRANTAEGGPNYFVVRLTAHGNEALRELCRTAEQREVWSWPSYEFLVKMRKNRTPVISADQVSSYSTRSLSELLRIDLDRSEVGGRRT